MSLFSTAKNLWTGAANLFLSARGDQRTRFQKQNTERINQYARWLRAYKGYAVRGLIGTSTPTQWKKVKFNFCAPIVNIGAGWLAAKPVVWSIKGATEEAGAAATAEAVKIWERSGSDAVLLENVRACCIYGDMVGIATQDAAGKPRIEFVDPNICAPAFGGSDYSELDALEFAYQSEHVDGTYTVHREMWGPAGVEIYEGETLTDQRPYDEIPAVWIRNSSIKGEPFGMSDIESIFDLVEEYDHVAGKQTRIIDYYASPNIWFSGGTKPTTSTEKQLATVYYLPDNGKCGFLEWSGTGPDTELQLTRIRNAIAEISETPAVAFGQADSGISSISGIALQILYGPLINKTRRKEANWGPALQKLMWFCLKAAGYESLELDDVKASFPSAVPVDGLAKANEAVVLETLGVSKETLISDLGYDPKNEAEKKASEQETAAELGSQLLDKFGRDQLGTPPPDPNVDPNKPPKPTGEKP